MIIALSGKRGTGKTASARWLERTYGFKRLSFADQLKNQAKAIFPFTDQHVNGSLKEEPFFRSGESPRDFMIKYGQFVRYFDNNYWLDSTIKEVGKYPNVVIDDVRYTNEANKLKSMGAKVVRINRYKKYNPYKEELNDASETELDNFANFDAFINEIENLTLTSLHNKLDSLMDKFNEIKP